MKGISMSSRLYPPGPPGHFLTGNLPELRRDSLAMYTRCAREFGDCASIRFGPRRIFVLSHPDLIDQVLVTGAANFTKHWGLRSGKRVLGNGLLTSEGDFWRRQRRLMQPAFNRERVASYGGTMVRMADRMLAAWHADQTRDVHEDLSRLTLEIAAATMFGADDVTTEADEVVEALRALTTGFNSRLFRLVQLPGYVPTPGNIRRERAARRLDDIIFDLIRRRRSDGGHGDLLGILLNARDEDDGTRMSDQQLRDEALTLFLAGHDTTALTLSWAAYLLARHPEVARALESEADLVLGGRAPTPNDLPRLRYAENVVQEVMRLYPPAYVIGRQAIEECEIAGYRVPARATVLMSQWVVHRDSRWYDEPEKFRPERWADGLLRRLPRQAYFPFGGGPRICIGNHFAMMEAVLVLSTVARRWHFSVPPGEGAVAPRPAVTLRPGGPIRLIVQPRPSIGRIAA
jgi:cytochrome P450